jgi:hypothetical protein
MYSGITKIYYRKTPGHVFSKAVNVIFFFGDMSKTGYSSHHCHRDLADLKARINAAVKNIDAPMLTRVWQELEYRIDMCRVTPGAHIKRL